MATYSVITNYQTTLAQGMTSSQAFCVLSTVTIQGHAITASDYGVYLYITINPGASNMEVVRATSNSGTTFTLDKRGLAFYGAADTELSAYKFTHNASEPVVISNVKNVYEQLVDRYSDETIGGVKVFSDLPQVPILPLLAQDVASKVYVDTIAQAAGGISAFFVTKNGSDPTLTVNVGAGYWMDNNTPVTFPGQSAFAISAASTNYVQLKGDNTVANSTVGFLEAYIPLAIVVANGTTITSVSDARAWLTNPDLEPLISSTYTYGGTISAGDPLYLDSADAKLKKALATGSTTADSFFGIAIDAGVNNDTGKRVQIGGVVTAITGMTAGYQYLTDAGGLSTTPGTYRKLIGFAPNTTTVVLSPGLRIENVSGANSFLTTGKINGVTARYGGDGSDGALAVTSGTTTIDLSNAEVVVKNYTSISISSGATLAFSNPATNGSIIVLRSQGNVTIAGTINADNLGAAGGAGGAGGAFPNGTGVTGSVGTQTQNAVTGTAGAGGVGNASGGGGGGGGAGGTHVSIGIAGTNGSAGSGAGGAGGSATAILGEVSRSSIQKYVGLGLPSIAPGGGGAGGGGGGNDSTEATDTMGAGGAGGRGGGAIVIQALGNAILTSGTINARGQVGTVGGDGVSPGVQDASGGGGGGGGSGGTILVYYNGTLTGSLTTAVTGGAGGAGGSKVGGSGAGGAGGAGGNGQAATIKNILY